MESWNFSSEGKTIFFSGETATSSMGLGLSEILCPNMISPNSSSLSLVDDESGSRVSSSLMESNNNNNNIQDSSLIALKLGSQNTATVDHCRRLRETTQISSSSSSPSPFKRARTRGCYSQTTPYCQVLGCNMDLSDSKDYHKKHKVCDAHSKTAKVIVIGVEQRFCQQCSRFHLLKEFDDGKRSCRRRLAGHNERRRKPQCDGLSDKQHRFSHSFQGNRYLGTSMQNRMPFVFSDILPGAVLSPENYEHLNPFGRINFEEKPFYSTNTQFLSNSEPLVQSEDGFFFDSAHRPLGAPDTPRALSLLSSQSQSFSCHLAGIPTLLHGGAHQTVPQLPDRPSRGRQGPAVVPEVGHIAGAAGFGVFSDRAAQGSNYLHPKYCLGTENGSTVDLLQLSSHLQRVEHQRSFMQVKHENDDFCCFPTA